MTQTPSCLALALCAALAACGGGGSDDAATPAPATTTSPTTPPTTPPITITPPVTTAGSTCGIADFAATALTRINQLRAAGASCGSKAYPPAAALTWSALLTQASEAHSQDMVAHNLFSHTGSSGTTFGSRITATGYQGSSIGENIAAGYPGLDAVLNGWMASEGHCANIMNPVFNQVGLVCVAGNASTSYNNYWTMDLAKSR